MRLSAETIVAIAFCWILAILVVPLPPLALDLLLSVSLTVSILILLLAIYTERPLDFSVFPSLLLMVTLLRLGLNVASTRLILLKGAEGHGAAGNVIQAFGDFTVGGDPTVGIILFAIFAVINFAVITKGAGRIAEVAARFTLDAMPGKQMAIDADLSQGVINDGEARARRKEVQREADFYGAMDGASKFVRGDAMAGVLILFVNIIGGLLLGVLTHDLPLAEAFHTYTILTVGDGLVSQVPALVVSTAAGVVVSRAAAGAPLADELRLQLFAQPRALAVAGGMLGALSLVPGLPFLPFAALGGGVYALSRRKPPKPVAAPSTDTEGAAAGKPGASEDTEIRQALTLDELELEVGYGLVPLVDPARGGELAGRIRSTRRQLASELGFVVPLVHIRDNLTLAPGAYRILLRGNPIAQREIPTNRLLAISPGGGAEKLPGIPGEDPAFGLPALWIQQRDRERAAAAGYAVVDPATAITTHLAEVVRTHASDLLSRQHVRDLLDQLAERMPRLVDDIVPTLVSLSVLHRTLRQLLSERVSIRDLATILETLAEYAARIQDPDLLTDLVRERLSRTIVRDLLGKDGSLHVLTLDPEIENELKSSVQRSESGSFLAVDAASLTRIVNGIERVALGGDSATRGSVPALLCSPVVRSGLRQVLSRTLPRLPVLSHSEIPAEIRIVGDGVVR
jgi:flagellar biosynthesis protein FlhA